MSEDRASQPGPRDFTEDQPATPQDPFICELCGDPLRHGVRFCSRTCYDEWQREGPLPSMTLDEMKAEMEGVVERLRSYPDDQEATS